MLTFPPLFLVFYARFLGCVCVSGIDTNLRDSQGRTALEILRDHPAPKSQQITALIQGKDAHTFDLDELRKWGISGVRILYKFTKYITTKRKI